ncbi:MAG: hypothetical protein UW71_C0028G0001, partial [Parcubacteria group bacterium GW2011_GWB1_44_7]
GVSWEKMKKFDIAKLKEAYEV